MKLYEQLPHDMVDESNTAESFSASMNTCDLSDLRFVPLPGKSYRFVKRSGDIVLSLLALLLLLVPMAILALAIYIDDPGSVLFCQKRVGRNGKRFRFYKFRTMRKETPKYLPTLELEHPEKYITRLGRFLRRYSLDELPQLFNVLKGDMSLVGPRPLISDEFEVHEMRMRLGVYNIRPGITGLAQVNGRDLCSPEDKVRWDLEYLKNFGLCQDVKIFLTTMPKVLEADGFAEGECAE